MKTTIVLKRQPGDPFICDLCGAEIAGSSGISVMTSYLVDSSLYCSDCYDFASHGIMEEIYPPGFDLTKAIFVKENRMNTITIKILNNPSRGRKEKVNKHVRYY